MPSAAGSPGEVEADTWVWGLAANGLRDCVAPLPEAPLTMQDWHIAFVTAQRERLEGQLAVAIASGRWPATDEQRDAAALAHRQAMALAVALEGELLSTAADFERRDVGFRVLKGPAIAHLDEFDPAVRCFGDLDLLVAGRQMEQAIGVIQARGGRRRYAEPRPGYDRRFTKGVSFSFARNVEVDLHRTLTLGPFGLTIDTEELFAGDSALTIGGVGLRALDRPNRFLHAAVHAVLGGARPRPVALRDLVLTHPYEDGELHLALARARRWQLEAPLAAAVRRARTFLGWSPPPLLAAWADLDPGTASHRRWLSLYEGRGRSSRAMALASLQALAGPRARLAYAWDVGVPERVGPAQLLERWRTAAPAIRRLLSR